MDLALLALPRPARAWSPTTREELIEIGAKVASHAKAISSQPAGVAVPRVLSEAIEARIGRLRSALVDNSWDTSRTDRFNLFAGSFR